ncbi:major facilitator superfamily protein [Sarocladium implicatum]|nr:major facilitator superfamily protein [Sarocladium implicatum]
MSADSQMTGETVQSNGREHDNGSAEKSASIPASNKDQAQAPAPSQEPAVGWSSDAPNGGLRAWLVVTGTWCTAFCSFGWLNSVGIFQEYYQNTLLNSYSPSTISWIPSLQIFFMMAMGPVVGILYDRHGPRELILVGTFLHVFGIMMTSLGKEYYQIMLAQGVCSALGVSAIFQPALNSVHGWFSTRVGAAFGVVATGSSIGGVIFPIMVTRLIREVGFGWAMRTCGFLVLALLIVANLTVRTIHPPRPKKMTSEDLARPFHEPAYVLLTLGFLLFTFGIYVPITYLPVQALAAGMDVDLITYLVPILNAASLFGRIFAGVLGDRIGRFNIFITVGFLTALWTLALWIPVESTGGIIAYATLFGFCSGAYVSLIAALIAQISPLREIGFRTGLIFFVSSFGGLTTSPINGAIMDGPSGLLGIKIFSGVFCFAGTAAVLAARVYKVGWNPTAKF